MTNPRENTILSVKVRRIFQFADPHSPFAPRIRFENSLLADAIAQFGAIDNQAPGIYDKSKGGWEMEPMQLNDKQYTPIRLLGKGKGGYSYLVTDGIGEYVLKQIHHEPCDYYTFGDKLQSELTDYRRLSDLGLSMPQLLAVDVARERLLKTYIPGDTVDVLVKEGRMEPGFYDQIRAMCRTLYEAGLNIDYYPTNFVVWDGVLYYIDFECNHYMQQWDFEHWGSQYWEKTREFVAAFGE